MEKEFVPYAQSLQLKELGFDKPCLAFYNTKVDESLSFVDLFGFLDEKIIDDYYYNSLGLYVSAPTFSQVFRWFREKSGLKSWIQEHTTDTFIYEIRPHKLTDYKEGEVYVYKVYEDAELALIDKLIEILKNKQ